MKALERPLLTPVCTIVFGFAWRTAQYRNWASTEIHPAGNVMRLVALSEHGEIVFDIGFALHHLVEAGDATRLLHHIAVNLPPGARRHLVPPRHFRDFQKQRRAAGSIGMIDAIREIANQFRLVIRMTGVVSLVGEQQRRSCLRHPQRAATTQRVDGRANRSADRSAQPSQPTLEPQWRRTQLRHALRSALTPYWGLSTLLLAMAHSMTSHTSGTLKP